MHKLILDNNGLILILMKLNYSTSTGHIYAQFIFTSIDMPPNASINAAVQRTISIRALRMPPIYVPPALDELAGAAFGSNSRPLVAKRLLGLDCI